MPFQSWVNSHGLPEQAIVTDPHLRVTSIPRQTHNDGSIHCKLESFLQFEVYHHGGKERVG